MTPLAVDVLQARLSLKETQMEFANRFRVSAVTVHKWEVGKVDRMHNIYKEILKGLIKGLEANGQLVPRDLLQGFFKFSESVRNAV